MAIHENATEAGRSRGRDIALNVGAIAGLICVLAAVASFLFGIKPLIFRSGSMAPDIPTGALALSKTTQAADLQVGDVVSVENQQGTRITHRVDEIVSSDGTSSVLILKGDANQDADLTPYTVTEADRVFFSVPGLGYVVSWLSSPAAIFLGGALVGGVMVLAFGPGSKRKDDDDSDSGSDADGEAPGAHGVGEPPPAAYAHAHDVPTESFRTQGFSMRRILSARAVIALGVVGLTAIGATTVGTAAAFTDNATAASTVKSAANFYPTPLVPSASCSTNGVWGSRSVTIKWTSAGTSPLGSAYQYRVFVKRNSDGYVAKDSGVISGLSYGSFRIGDTARGYRAEVHTVNNGVMSTGWMGHNMWASTHNADTYCDGGQNNTANPAFENDIYGGLGPASAGGNFLRAAPGVSQPEVAGPSATSTTSAQSTVETTESTTVSPSSTTVATTTPSTVTTPPTTTSTGQPSSTSTEPSSTTVTSMPVDGTTAATTTNPVTTALDGVMVSPSGAYTAGRSGSDAVVQDASGKAVFTTPVPGSTVLQWDATSDRLWMVDGDVVRYVDAGSWTLVTVDSASGDIPEAVAALIK
ncbi:signal peptidase I [Rhodococcus sp. ABRD24]|uniref:signal peptidase I n=1 Tax=Rhodococcus sp. ABRD24 TaxID=2507582 RepID=UPI0010388098|nr:signal peptidase I [Rhodococcus sp. ABRD24]QBJ97347.1 signal peptidase I [Rhodococcus sp. ABRD24]